MCRAISCLRNEVLSCGKYCLELTLAQLCSRAQLQGLHSDPSILLAANPGEPAIGLKAIKDSLSLPPPLAALALNGDCTRPRVSTAIRTASTKSLLQPSHLHGPQPIPGNCFISSKDQRLISFTHCASMAGIISSFCIHRVLLTTGATGHNANE